MEEDESKFLEEFSGLSPQLEESSDMEQPSISKAEFVRELAYHEASHLVFGILARQTIKGFRKSTSVNICPEKYFKNFQLEQNTLIIKSTVLRQIYLSI